MRPLRLILAVLLLAMGGAIYLLYRPHGLLLLRLTDWLGFSGFIEPFRHVLSPPSPFIVYSFPGGLWASSYILFVTLIPEANRTLAAKLFYPSIIPIIGILTEMLQGAGFCPGQSDWMDVLCYCVPYVVYSAFILTSYYLQKWK